MVEHTELLHSIPADSYPLQLIVLPGEEIQLHQKHSCLTSCQRLDSQVPQPVELLLLRSLEPRTLHLPTQNATQNAPRIVDRLSESGLNLLMGGRMGQYTGSLDILVFHQRINLRAFSPGSFAGLSTLHLLWANAK